MKTDDDDAPSGPASAPSSSSSSSSFRHLPALDGVRGIAIALVVAHMLNPLVSPAGPAAKALVLAFGMGWVGVQLFFVLSGFLITGILLDTRGAENFLSAFFARRVLRIFPLYYATLFVTFALVPLLGVTGPALAHDRGHQIWLWTYLENWVAPFAAGSRVFPHFWSLAVEEQFYLIWPFVLRGRGARSCLVLCLALAAASLAARIALLAVGGSSDEIYTFTVTRMDALALGGAGAAALRIPNLSTHLTARRGRLWWTAAALGLGGMLLTRGYSRESVSGATLGYTILSVTFALGVVAAAAADVTRAPASWLRASPLRALGRYSYGMYVFHKPLHDLVGKRLLARLGTAASRSPALACIYVTCGLAVTFAAAYVSYRVFESRFLRLKTRFVPRLAEQQTIK
ncbi:MAG TPA: acyltransferase [Polyangia bacterium]|nr:acyltransferase [Polyangia bacterium]